MDMIHIFDADGNQVAHVTEQEVAKSERFPEIPEGGSVSICIGPGQQYLNLLSGTFMWATVTNVPDAWGDGDDAF